MSFTRFNDSNTINFKQVLRITYNLQKKTLYMYDPRKRIHFTHEKHFYIGNYCFIVKDNHNYVLVCIFYFI